MFAGAGGADVCAADGCDNVRVLLRPRLDSDLDACADIVRDVHALDRYPHFLPGDLRAFLASTGAYGAWVADRDGDIVGHVALHQRSEPSVMEVASSALGIPHGRLAVVARLFVSPRVRGQGAGQRLLEAATADAQARGLWPVLDVAADLAAAMALYDSRGWVRAGKATVCFSEGQTLDEYVYLGPPAVTAGSPGWTGG
jgi:GNAT superfamily N-acetyltransferase